MKLYWCTLFLVHNSFPFCSYKILFPCHRLWRSGIVLHKLCLHLKALFYAFTVICLLWNVGHFIVSGKYPGQLHWLSKMTVIWSDLAFHVGLGSCLGCFPKYAMGDFFEGVMKRWSIAALDEIDQWVANAVQSLLYIMLLMPGVGVVN